MARAKGQRKGVRSVEFGDALPRITEAAWVRRQSVSEFVRIVAGRAADRVLARQRLAAPEVEQAAA